MKLNKNILICTLVMIVMLCVITTASAEENVNENLTVTDTDETIHLTVSDSDERLSEGNTITVDANGEYKSISSAISDARDGDTIFIKNGEYSESSRIDFQANKSLNFIGESNGGVIISSTANNGLFYSSNVGNKFIFENLVFKNIKAGNFASLYIGGNCNLDIINCTFDNCSGKWGSVYIFTSAITTMEDCTILNSKASSGSGSAAIGFAGSGTNYIKNTIINNTQYSGSSGYSYGVIASTTNSSVIIFDNVSILNSDIIGNGIVYTKANMMVKNSKIINNTLRPLSTGYQGDSVFYSVGNSNFKGNLTVEQSIIWDNNCSAKTFITSYGANAKVVFNYNNIQNNFANTTFTSGSGTVNLEYNYWGSDGIPYDVTVTYYAIMDSEGNFKDNLENELAKEIPVLTQEESEPTALDIIYVSNNGDDENDGNQNTPVKSISKAIEIAEKGKIIILAGNYTLTETLTINKDLDIKGSGQVFIKCDSQIITNTAKLNLTNITFESNENIISTSNDLNVNYCVFYIDSEINSAIYVNGGNVVIADSVLLNPSGYALTKSEADASIVAENNWWGNNTSPNTQVEITSWIVMNVDIDLERINAGDKVTITVSFNKTNTGSDYEGSLPQFNITITASNLNENSVVKNNKASVVYTVDSDDEATIKSGSESIIIPLNIYVPPDIIYVNATGGLDTNDGDEDCPVLSISKAVELAWKGKIIILEGTYTLSDTLEISKDLDITGQGNVVIDANSKRFLTNTANLNITNVEIINAVNNSGAILNNGNLTLNNVSVHMCVNNVGSGASVVRNNKKLTIINSKFYDNEALRGNIHNEKGDLTIINTEFYNNKFTQDENAATGYGIYNYQGNVNIENTTFRQNDGNSPLIYSYTSPNTLTITNCTFENNNMSKFGVVVAQNTVFKIKNSSFINNYAKKTSTQNSEAGAIYISNGEVNITESQFINNKADSGKDIYVNSGNLTISESVLINENGYSIEKSSQANVILNDNWWGSNTPNTQITVDRWIIMTVSCNDSDIQNGDEIKLTVSFDKTNSTEGTIAPYTGNLASLTVAFTSQNLNEVKTTTDKKVELTYTVGDNDKNITITSSNASETLNVRKILDVIYVSNETGDDENDGDINTPVKTLSKAIELAEREQIVILKGKYETGDLGIISKNLTITGDGEVILDAQNSNRILYVGNESNIVLKNLIMINGVGIDESGALLGNSNNLTIINCTLANSNAGENNGGAIYNVGQLIIINSTIANNTAKVGGAIFAHETLAKQATITIINSIFENNNATGNSNNGGGAIFAQQTSDIKISNTTFKNNNALTNSSGGAILISLFENNVNITGSEFINNKASNDGDCGGGAIYITGSSNYVRSGSLTISNTLFENNTCVANGGSIYLRATTLKISTSVLINNTDAKGYSIYGYGTEQINPSIDANNNWWGSNDNPKSLIGGYRFTPTISKWAVLTVSNASEIKQGSTVTLTATINTLNDGTTLDEAIAIKRDVTINTNIEDIEGVLINGDYSYDLTVPEGLKFISASVDSETQVLFVISTKTNVSITNISANKGDRVEYIINVTSGDGDKINKGNIELYIDSTLIKTIPVLDGIANTTILISKDIGNYTITAKYIDSTEEFTTNSTSQNLEVIGINNVVSILNLDDFFEDGVLKTDIPFDEIFLKGEFNNLETLTITKSIKITGDGAILNNTALKITADDVCIDNIKFISTVNLYALIYSEGKNTSLINNVINYTPQNTTDSYAIYGDGCDNLKLINNTINYKAMLGEDIKTIGVYIIDSDDIIVSNNTFKLEIPSLPILTSGMEPYYYSNPDSIGIALYYCNNLTFNKNNVTVEYSDFDNGQDTIDAVHIQFSNNSKITNNNILLNGHSQAYALYVDGSLNVEIKNNEIISNSDNGQSNTVNLNGLTSAVVDNNNITAKGQSVIYPIYLNDLSRLSVANITNNLIVGESPTVYGIYVEENQTNIINNTIIVKGNYVMGILSHASDVSIKNNNISVDGQDDGDIINPQSGAPSNTTAICISRGSLEITDNNVKSTLNSTIIAINTVGLVKNNNLTAGELTGNNTIINQDSDLNFIQEIINQTNTTPTPTPHVPVYKITADNLNMYYNDGAVFKFRLTADGKAVVRASVKVTLAGSTQTLRTDANGYASFKIINLPGKYTVVIAYNTLKVSKEIQVKQVLTSSNVKVKKSAKKLTLKATLKHGSKAVKGKQISFKFNGKTYKAKTNSKGIAQITIKKNVIKKLKANKKYVVKITYAKNTIQKTVTVKK